LCNILAENDIPKKLDKLISMCTNKSFSTFRLCKYLPHTLYLHRVLNKVTQSANQHMHTFSFLFIKTYLKFLKAILHVSVIRPSSGSL